MDLIIGGTGSFGSRYAKHRVGLGGKVRIFSRDEFKQYEMRKGLPEAEYVIGDVRDYEAVASAMVGCDRVVHAAALKHVRTGEEYPQEVIKTNVIGTANVVNAAKAAGVELVFISTDKACSPVNTYGATKMLAERLVVSAGFNAVRYGNVIGSRGSVLHIFNEIESGGVFRITDRRMTRFAVTFGYAIYLVGIAFGAKPGTIVVGKPPSMSIVDLALSFDPDAVIEETGVQAGEKLHEALMTEGEAARAESVVDYFLLRQDRGGMLPPHPEAFTSEKVTMSIDDIKEMIRESL